MKKPVFVLFLFLVGVFYHHGSRLLAGNNWVASEYPNAFYSYDSNGNGMFWVYVNVKDSLYTKFKINHEVNEKQNKNLWRVMDSYFAIYNNGVMNQTIQILTAGENEFVWLAHRPDVVEFTGGFHGNERIDSDASTFAKFYADGVEIDMTKSHSLVSCNSFHYHQKSFMFQTGTGGTITSPNYQPIENAPVECVHEKMTTFSNGGYKTDNKVTWGNNSTPIKRMYYGIFCVTGEVSKYGYNDTGVDNPTIIPLIDDGTFKLKSPTQRVVMFDDVQKISVVCDANVLSGSTFKLNTTVWDHRFYHKYYTAIDNGVAINTTAGEVWSTSASIKFQVYQGNDYTAVEQKINDENRLNVVYEEDGYVTIQNIEDILSLFDVQGKLISTTKPTENSIARIRLKKRGVYFAKTRNECVKIIM